MDSFNFQPRSEQFSNHEAPLALVVKPLHQALGISHMPVLGTITQTTQSATMTGHGYGSTSLIYQLCSSSTPKSERGSTYQPGMLQIYLPPETCFEGCVGFKADILMLRCAGLGNGMGIPRGAKILTHTLTCGHPDPRDPRCPTKKIDEK